MNYFKVKYIIVRLYVEVVIVELYRRSRCLSSSFSFLITFSCILCRLTHRYTHLSRFSTQLVIEANKPV